MDKHLVGMAAGGALVMAEVAMIMTATFYRKWTAKKAPWMLHAAAIGVKTTSYRCFAGLDTMVVTWFMTGNLMAAGAIVGMELATKFFLYYGHEWVWNRPFLAKFVRGEVAPAY